MVGQPWVQVVQLLSEMEMALSSSEVSSLMLLRVRQFQQHGPAVLMAALQLSRQRLGSRPGLGEATNHRPALHRHSKAVAVVQPGGVVI